MKDWTINEVERAVKWNSPIDILLEYVSGNSVMDFNISQFCCYDDDSIVEKHYNRFKENPKDKVVIWGKISPEGNLKLIKYKGADGIKIKDNSLCIGYSEERKVVEICAGLDKNDKGVLELSPLGVPLEESVWE
jgi:hypothetical protein